MFGAAEAVPVESARCIGVISFHSAKSPSAVNVAGGFTEIVGTPLAMLVTKSELAASPTFPGLSTAFIA